MAKEQGPCPSHPGEILRDLFNEVEGITVSGAADKMGVSRQWLYQLMREGDPQPVTPEMAVRLGKLFGNGADLWMNLQVQYDLWHARRSVDVDNIPTVKKSAA